MLVNLPCISKHSLIFLNTFTLFAKVKSRKISRIIKMEYGGLRNWMKAITLSFGEIYVYSSLLY